MEDQFQLECERSQGLCGTYDFMDRWHKRNQGLNDVVSKVIRYYCLNKDPRDHFNRHLVKYVGTGKTNDFGKMAIMLKSRESFYSIVFMSMRVREMDDAVRRTQKLLING